MKKAQTQDGRTARRKSRLLRWLAVLVFSVALLSTITVAAIQFIKHKFYSENSVYALYDFWKKNEIDKVYDLSGKILQKHVFQKTALTLRGYSSFKLAISNISDINGAQAYLDEAINRLRIAIQASDEKTQGQTYYVLGLSYFYRNRLSSYHYYADLAVKYLLDAKERGYKSDDINELLGYCYAGLGETEMSIQAFSEALLVHETPSLLYNIAKEYYGISERAVAKQYLARALMTTDDDELKINSRNILGKIYLDEGDYEAARKEFETILEKNENFADAHYGLGILYEKQGDNAKARAEWRKCLKLQVKHAGALQKLSEIK
jgi:tetratricopeptide (TPR) repeat protein